MRTLFIGGVLAILVFALSACGGSGGSSASEHALQRKADVYDIGQIERQFHRAVTEKDINESVGLVATHATGTFGPRATAVGRQQIRTVRMNSEAWKPTTHWVSDHPAWKLKVTVDGDKGTLHF